MIPTPIRLSLRGEKDFFKKSKRLYLQTMTCFWQEADQPQFAVIVPKKQVKLATDRNRMKRQVLHALYREIKEVDEKMVKRKAVVVLKKHQKFEDLYQKDIETIFENFLF